MERREIFRLALRSGAVASIVRLSEAPATASDLEAAAKVEFQKGTLSGGKFTGWEALLAITGRAVRGTIYDPGSLGGSGFIGFRVRGEARGKALDLDIYDLDDLSFEKPVGGGKGKDKGRKTTTHFEVDAGNLAGKQEGSMTSRSVPLSSRSARQLAGTYAVQILERETEAVRAEFRLAALPNGKFTIDELSQDGAARLNTVVAGRFGVTRDGAVYTTMLIPPPGEVTYDFDPSEVNLMVPEQPPTNRLDGIGLLFSGCILYQSCYLSALQYDKGTLVGTVTNGTNRSPLAGARVDANGIQTLTGADGGYALSLVEGSHVVEISMEGFRPETFRGVAIEKDQQTRRDAALTPAQRITATGKVLGFTASGSTQPLAGAEVTLVSAAPNSQEIKVTTGNDGRYSQSLIEGAYRVTAAKAHYEERSIEAQLSQKRPTVPDLILPLLPTVRYFGRVLSRPRPNDVINVSEAQVSLHDWETDELRYTQNTGVADERFDFPDVEAGHYRVRIIAGGYFHPYAAELTLEQTLYQEIYLDYVHRNFRDDDLPTGAWEIYKVIDTSPGNNSIVTVAQIAAGGVDNSSFRRYRAQQPLGTTVASAHLRTDAVYSPSFGAIRTVQFIADLRSLVGQTNGNVGYCLALRQGDTIFATDTEIAPHPTGWDGRHETGVTADKLWDVATRTQHPFFGAGGSPITFGYLVRTHHPTNESGLDNWRINLDTEIAD